MAETLIKIDGVRKEYKVDAGPNVVALNGVNLEIKENEYSKGKKIEYSNECQMYMIQLYDGTFYPLYSTLYGKEPLIINGEKLKRTKDYTRVVCNRLQDIKDLRG